MSPILWRSPTMCAHCSWTRPWSWHCWEMTTGPLSEPESLVVFGSEAEKKAAVALQVARFSPF